jgi:uncharacterized NAD-dependent epimerase/dehydratase family protein
MLERGERVPKAIEEAAERRLAATRKAAGGLPVANTTSDEEDHATEVDELIPQPVKMESKLRESTKLAKRQESRLQDLRKLVNVSS